MALKLSNLTVVTCLLAAFGAADSEVLSYDSAIAAVTDTEQVSLEPTLESSHFKNGLPSRYLRHRIVRIDTARLKAQLQKDWDSK